MRSTCSMLRLNPTHGSCSPPPSTTYCGKAMPAPNKPVLPIEDHWYGILVVVVRYISQCNGVITDRNASVEKDEEFPPWTDCIYSSVHWSLRTRLWRQPGRRWLRLVQSRSLQYNEWRHGGTAVPSMITLRYICGILFVHVCVKTYTYIHTYIHTYIKGEETKVTYLTLSTIDDSAGSVPQRFSAVHFPTGPFNPVPWNLSNEWIHEWQR